MNTPLLKPGEEIRLTCRTLTNYELIQGPKLIAEFSSEENAIIFLRAFLATHQEKNRR